MSIHFDFVIQSQEIYPKDVFRNWHFTLTFPFCLEGLFWVKYIGHSLITSIFNQVSTTQ